MTQTTQIAALDASVQKTNEWLKDLGERLDVDRETAYKILRGYLQTVRDCLDVGEASDFAAQLPVMIRGIYYTGWNPADTPAGLDRERFVSMLRERAALAGDDPDPQTAASAMTGVLQQQITDGAVADVFTQLRRDVRAVVAPEGEATMSGQPPM